MVIKALVMVEEVSDKALVNLLVQKLGLRHN